MGFVVLLGVCSGLAGSPIERWTWRYPQPQGRALFGVTYGDGLFVAAGAAGTIITSEDGVRWTTQTWGVFPDLFGVAYSSGYYVAVGRYGFVAESSDGADGVEVDSPTTRTLLAIAGNQFTIDPSVARFVAVGEAGVSVATWDLDSWTELSTGIMNDLNAIIACPGRFCAVGDGGAMLQLSGHAWSYLGSPVPLDFHAITAGNDRYLASADGGVSDPGRSFTLSLIFTSKDLISWQEVPATDFANLIWPLDWISFRGLASRGGIDVAVGYPAYTLETRYPGVLMTSTNGAA